MKKKPAKKPVKISIVDHDNKAPSDALIIMREYTKAAAWNKSCYEEFKRFRSEHRRTQWQLASNESRRWLDVMIDYVRKYDKPKVCPTCGKCVECGH